jgi:hypothetical protein
MRTLASAAPMAPMFCQRSLHGPHRATSVFRCNGNAGRGVRVFRPLPPHERVIINPGSKTRFFSGFCASRSYNANYNYNYDEGFVGVPMSTAATFPGRRRFRHGHKGQFRSLGGPATLRRSLLQGQTETCR